MYGVPLQIHRTFSNVDNPRIRPKEAQWVRDGGILFYSIQPKNWAEYAEGGSKDEEIVAHAEVVKELAPHKIMVVVGFEPDAKVPETCLPDKPEKV